MTTSHWNPGELEDALTEARRLREKVEQYQRIQVGLLRELDAARGALRDQERIHDNFLRMISHELKTPISSIDLTLRVLEREPLGPRSDRLRTGLERLTSSTRRLSQLVNTTTEWTRIRSGRRPLHPAPLDLDSRLERAVDASRRYAERKGLLIELHARPDMPPLVSEGELVDLLLANLVMRAVQLSSRGTVSVRARRDEGRHVVEVEDTAEPIRAVEELFDPLRSPTELLRRCGSGSGLAISVLDDITRALQGDLRLAPGDASGNIVILGLPPLRTDGETEAR